MVVCDCWFDYPLNRNESNSTEWNVLTLLTHLMVVAAAVVVMVAVVARGHSYIQFTFTYIICAEGKKCNEIK